MTHHPVPPEDCDVCDKESLRRYRSLRHQWLEMLNGDDYHAISRQIARMLDADLHFRTIAFARELCREAGVRQNAMVHSFIDQGFFMHQAFGIRRVTEHYNGRKLRKSKACKAPYSLPRIISEIKDSTDLITREVYVCVDGDPYLPTGNLDRSEYRHQTFDKLSWVDERGRSRNDQIDPRSFGELDSRLKSRERIRLFVNRIFAHAAAPATRKACDRLTLLDAVYADLAWIANRLSRDMLGGPSIEFLPTYTHDKLAFIDNAVCPAEKLRELREFWENRKKTLEQMV